VSAQETFGMAEARSVRIEDEIARRGIRLQGRGSERVGPCPDCGGHDRFSINIKKQLWNCRGCGYGGDVIALVRHLDGLSFGEAVRLLTGAAAAQKPAPSARHGNGDARKEQGPARDAPYDPKAAFEFTYHDESGTVLYRVNRTDHKGGKRGKSFFQNPPDPNSPGRWLTGKGCMDGVRRVPYHLPELLEAFRQGETVLIVEGERKTDLLRYWGIRCNMQ
jgi:CHC2 zinc finger